MREIKFRAWDLEQRQMITSDYEYQLRLLSSAIGSDNWSGAIGEQTPLEADLFKLMQSTGLKDKNGVEIYESDVLRWTDETGEVEDYKVIYRAPSFMYSHVHNPEYIGGTSAFDELEAEMDFEVVGNIYENPELLKGDNK